MEDAPVAQNTRLAVDVCDFGCDDRCVQEALVGHTQSALGLVLLALARGEGRLHRLERRCGDAVVRDPAHIRRVTRSALRSFSHVPV